MSSQATVVALEGEIDIAVRDEVGERLQTAAASGEGPIVVDLAEVTFMDSSGLAALADLVGVADDREVRLRQPSVQVRRVLELSGLLQVATIE